MGDKALRTSNNQHQKLPNNDHNSKQLEATYHPPMRLEGFGEWKGRIGMNKKKT
jgi:hypothetical protein